MSADAMFWWNWWVNVAVATGTITAVLVALFGDAFRAKFFPPKLSLELANRNGEATRVQGSAGQEEARYYHVRVSNSRRWSPANQVQIVLLQVEEPDPNRNLQVVWRGDIPIGWRHQQLFPIARTIGGEAYADLCSVGEGLWLRLHLLLVPFNLLVVRNQPSTLVLTLQARGSEADSLPLRIRIAWDGGWHQGEVEMRHHMVIETIT